jgi:hypothetical protein
MDASTQHVNKENVIHSCGNTAIAFKNIETSKKSDTLCLYFMLIKQHTFTDNVCLAPK